MTMFLREPVALGTWRILGQFQILIAVATIPVRSNRSCTGTDVRGVDVVLVAGVLGQSLARIAVHPGAREGERPCVVLQVRDRHLQGDVMKIRTRPPLCHPCLVAGRIAVFVEPDLVFDAVPQACRLNHQRVVFPVRDGVAEVARLEIVWMLEVLIDRDPPVRVVEVQRREPLRCVQDFERKAAAVVTRNAAEHADGLRIDGVVLAVEQRAPSEIAERQDETSARPCQGCPPACPVHVKGANSP